MEWNDCVALFHSGSTTSDGFWRAFQCTSRTYPYEIQLAQTLFSVIFGAGGFAFGIWRAWRYREKLLFSRLQDFLGHQAVEVDYTAQEIFAKVIRPSIDQPGFTSFDGLLPLAQIKRSFAPVMAFAATRTAAQQYLESSASSLAQAQTDFAQFHALALKKALSARLLCGAIDASTAAKTSNETEKQLHTQAAHEHIALARQMPDCGNDPQALEIEINLLLGEYRYDEAAALAENIIAPIPNIFVTDKRSALERDLCIGRAHKYQALAAIASNNPGRAAKSIKAALSKFRNYPHVRELNLLDFAHIAELRAACAKRLQATQQQDRYSKLAEVCYAKLRDASDPWKRGLLPWILSKIGSDKFHTYLSNGAFAGLERTRHLRSDATYFPSPFPPLHTNNSPATAPPA